MQQSQQNKAFITRYFTAISGVVKTPELIREFTTDEKLVNHIQFFDEVFPKYELIADEMTAEDNRVVVLARFRGIHQGVLNGILPTHRLVEFAFMISYKVENGMITHHTLIADQVALMEQLERHEEPATAWLEKV